MNAIERCPTESEILERIAGNLAEWNRRLPQSATKGRPALDTYEVPEPSAEDEAEAQRELDAIDRDAAQSQLVCTFRQECEADVRIISQDGDFSDYSMSDLLLDILSGEASTNMHGPFLAQAMGLPADPWIGLTGDDLVLLTKGRVREAKRRGIVIYPSRYELPFVDKLRAVKHRDWLLAA